jgi:flagella basal body P-ring formation protein FlgA
MDKWGSWITASTAAALGTVWLALVLGIWMMPTAHAAAPAPAPATTPAAWPVDAADQARLPAAWREQIERLVRDTTELPPQGRLEVQVGTPSPQLKLAPCASAEPSLPGQPRRFGSGRVALRCTSGARWNLYLPITVKVHAPAVVLAQSAPAGTELTAANLKIAEVDIAATPSPTFAQVDALIGRRLAVGMAAGTEVRQSDLRVRQWFAAGDAVTLVASGSGFAVEGEGEAMAPGVEGQTVRVRTPSGRIVSGTPVGERRVEVPL